MVVERFEVTAIPQSSQEGRCCHAFLVAKRVCYPARLYHERRNRSRLSPTNDRYRRIVPVTLLQQREDRWNIKDAFTRIVEARFLVDTRRLAFVVFFAAVHPSARKPRLIRSRSTCCSFDLHLRTRLFAHRGAPHVRLATVRRPRPFPATVPRGSSTSHPYVTTVDLSRRSLHRHNCGLLTRS